MSSLSVSEDAEVKQVASMPLVTLITPAYNQADFLAATIDSVLAQDYPALEYLVLDDGSTDHTPEVLQRYAGRVRYERHPNMGQSRTLNKGWAAAKGEYLGYLSADDLLLPDAISNLVKVLQARPGIAVAYGDFHLIDAKGKLVKEEKTKDFSLQELTEDLICHVGVGALFRRDVFERCGGWNPTLRKVPDFEYWLRVSQHGDFVRLPKPVGLYRVHAESTAIKPLPPKVSQEISDTMHQYWAGREHLPQAKRSLSKAHFMAAQNHAQSGRPIAALGQIARAIRYAPKTVASRSRWRTLMGAFLLRYVNRIGWLSARLRY